MRLGMALASGSGRVTGSWAINDQGQLCTKTLIVNLRQSTDSCVHVFKLGSDYFGSISDTDRAAPATRRTHTKSLRAVRRDGAGSRTRQVSVFCRIGYLHQGLKYFSDSIEKAGRRPFAAVVSAYCGW
jgi:hypothetical protein